MFLLFDIGGTKTRVGLSKDLNTLEGEPEVFHTPEKFEEGVQRVSEVSDKLLGEEKPQMACGGIAGPVDKQRTKLVNSPNIPEWVNKPLREQLEEELGCPVIMDNDTALVGLGEWAQGAGQKADIMGYITVSTGVGGSRIVEGCIDKSVHGFEPGHQIIDIDRSASLHGEIEASGNKEKPNLEDTVSGSALEARAGKKPYEIEDEKMWDDFAKVLSVGIHNTVVHWSPEVLVLGGSMIVGSPGISIEKVQEYLKQELYIYPAAPKIEQAELGDYGGLYGAMELIKQNLY